MEVPHRRAVRVHRPEGSLMSPSSIEVPSWVPDTVFYQVFPDRFARSDRLVAPGVFEPWDAPPTRAGFKGGDLFGLAARLDDLVDLGIDGLYLNPIFTAASNHRYNTSDYLAVDPLLGGERAFRERLDVTADTEDPTFWPEFRRRVRAVNPDAYLVGEVWSEAPEWLKGDRFDALMNYPLGIAILGYASGGRLDQAAIDSQRDYRESLQALDGPAFGARLEWLAGRGEPEVTEAQYNLIGSHDTPRARTVLAGDVAALRLAMLVQLTLPGAPSIYYGDELGMEGGADPDCRRGYPVAPDDEGLALRSFVRAAIRAR